MIPAFFARNTDAVLRAFTKTVVRLQRIADNQDAKAVALVADADALYMKADAASLEASRARAVADRLTKLIG